MDKFTCYSVKTGRKLELCNHGFEATVDYLTEMSEKPKIIVPIYRNEDNAREIQKSILSGPIPTSTPPSVGANFIYSMLDKMKGVLTEEWSSYGIRIGGIGDEVTPLNLITVIPKEQEFLGQAGQTTSTMSDWGILAKCLMVYRVSLAPQAQAGYRTDLQKRLHQIFMMDPFYVDNVSGVLGLQHWISDPTFCGLIAAIDMFLRKFPRHDLERLRACTLGSQYRDCVIIGSISHTAKVLNTTPGGVFGYIFNKAVAEEAEQVYAGEGEEKTKKDSYFQYMRDFSLVGRTAYSASANPNLFIWCHMIGALAGKRRSMYARFIDCSNPVLLLTEAMYIVHYLGSTPDIDLRFVATEAENERIQRHRAQLEAAGIATSDRTTPDQILQFMRENNMTITQEMRDKFSPIIGTIDGSRPGTVGEFVKNYFEKLP